MTTTSAIAIDTREDLLYLLAEAAEIEHNLMCCYLYAAWSIKTGADQGLSAVEAEAAQRWKRAIISVAVEEMSHLALASNLMVSIGGAPHFARPNFPVAPGYHPSGVVVELARFDMQTLDHFIYLERPEGNTTEDAASFPHVGTYRRSKRSKALMPSAQDYETVGELYRAIRNGFDAVAAEIGEKTLFCVGEAAQLSAADASLPGLAPVTSLATAHAAIDTIISQGEGAPGHAEYGHYARFLSIKAEFEKLKGTNPAFDPAHNCARNPVMRKPLTPENRVHITEAPAADAVDLANALYGVMLRALSQSYGRTVADVTAKRRMLDTAIDAMFAMAQLAEHLATLPANAAYPGVTAGITFTMLRDVGRMPEGSGELLFLHERLSQVAGRAAELYPPGHALAALSDTVRRIAARFAPSLVTPTPAPVQAPMAKDNLQGDIEVAEGKDITIRFEAKRCIHARFCVLGAPKVFKANTPGEWIFPDNMDTEKLIAVAEACPSGAITYARKTGKANETPPPVNVARIRENGPYAIHAALTINGQPAGHRATLCRCGASKNKPFCDGSHNAAGFTASGEPATRDSQPLTARDGPLDITPLRDGPLAVSGNLEICAGTGRTVDRVTSAKLCRCGASRNKPYCDGTHKSIGFTDQG